MQYAHARARSILAKINNNAGIVSVDYLDDYERLLAAKLSEYTESVNKAAVDYMPHHICVYLYELAQVFNRFYENSKVVGDSRQDIRQVLVQRYADTLKAGLNILGIDAIDRM